MERDGRTVVLVRHWRCEWNVKILAAKSANLLFSVLFNFYLRHLTVKNTRNTGQHNIEVPKFVKLHLHHTHWKKLLPNQKIQSACVCRPMIVL